MARRQNAGLDKLIEAGKIYSNTLMSIWLPEGSDANQDEELIGTWRAKRSQAVAIYSSETGKWSLEGTKKIDVVRFVPDMSAAFGEVVEEGALEAVAERRIFEVLGDVFKHQVELRTIPTQRLPEVFTAFAQNLTNAHPITFDLGAPQATTDGMLQDEAIKIIQECAPRAD